MKPLLRLEGAVIALSATRRLAPIDLAVAPGEVVALLGRNGAGKTSLLRAAVGLKPLAAGRGFMGDLEVSAGVNRNALARRCAYLPQGESGADTELTVAELMELGRAPYLGFLGRLGPVDRQAIDSAAAAAELTTLMHRSLDTLSAGERQRAHLGRCFAQDTALLVLDEPTSSLDPEHAMELLARVRERVATGARGALIVLHDLMLAARFADRVALLGDDRLMALGRPGEVLSHANLRDALGIDGEVRKDGDEVVLRMHASSEA